MISAKTAADISTRNCTMLEEIEELIMKTANIGERCIRYDKKISDSMTRTLEDLGYEVVFRQLDGGFTNETYIRW